MARSRETKIELTAYDDLFQTDESREEAKLSKIRDIPISEIDEFPDHPFKVLMDEDMEQLVESIKRNGVMTPATVRLKEDGRYELISGHRRKKACELAGLETLKCEVKELTRDEAIIVMVESNLQRSVILPSEKAFAYKMRLEAMKRQGERSDLTSSPMGTKLRSDAELAEKVGESRNQIQRYIRLTELVPEILQMVDERQIAFRPAVEISYLTEEQQYTLLEAMEYNDATPSLAQAIKMKKYNETQSDTVTIQAKLDKANSRLTNLIAMRADGEISKDEYQAMRSPVDEEIKKLQKALDEIPQEKSNPKGLDIEGIRSTLNSFIDFSGSTISHDVVNQFVYLITPTSDTTFDWYVNLNGTADVKATFTAEGRKKNCIIKLEEIEKISSVHREKNEDNAHFIKNPHIFTYLHRLH